MKDKVFERNIIRQQNSADTPWQLIYSSKSRRFYNKEKLAVFPLDGYFVLS